MDLQFTNLSDTKPAASAHEGLSRVHFVIKSLSDCNVSRRFASASSHTNMRYLIPLLALLLIGCDGENSNVAPSKDSPEETASGTKPPEAVSVNPNLKYGIKGDAVTITGCDKKASGELIIPANIEGKLVTSIGYGAFSSCDDLTTITISNGVYQHREFCLRQLHQPDKHHDS